MTDSTPGTSPISAGVGESRLSFLIRIGSASPKFLQGVFPFAGRGMFDAVPLDDTLIYTVPNGKTAEVVYFRAGNLSDDLIYFSLTRNDQHIRYFPVSPKGDVHVSLAVVEPHYAGERLGICIAAPRGLTGTVIVDVGVVEIEAEG